jgi:chromosome segregation ATPase
VNELSQEIANLEAKQTEIQRRLDAAETDEEARQITDELNIVYNALSPKYEELRLAQEKQQQVQQVTQAQEEHNGGLKEAMRQIFGAVCPSNLAEAVGLTEYGEMMQTFNQLSEEAVDENNAVLYGMIGQQIEAKDAKIQELTMAIIGLQSDVQDARGKAEQAWNEIDELNSEKAQLEARVLEADASIRILAGDVDTKQREVDGLNTVIQTKDEEISRLREELNRAPASRNAIDVTPYKPSVTLQDKINDTQNRIKSAVELALEGRQFRGRIVPGEIAQPEAPALEFQGEHTSTNTQVDRLPTPEVVEVVTSPEASFQGQTDLLAGHGDGKGETLEARVAKLEQAVFGWQAVA